ncbi:MAG: YCF48-related protein [Gammaproteobacteria bacterium]
MKSLPSTTLSRAILFRTTLLRTTIALLIIFLAACSGQQDPPSTAPASVTVTVGSGLAVVNWDKVPGNTYWIFYNEGANVSLNDFDRILLNVSPPFVATGLTNDTEYAFAVTSSKDGSKVGPFSPVQTTTPRLLSPNVDWIVGTALGGGTNDLQSIAFGNSTYVTVGDATTVFAAPYDYPSLGGVTGWVTATTLPDGLTTDLTSVVFDGARFVALGENGLIIKSTDAEALIWESATAIGVPTMNALAVGVGKYVAVGDTGAIYTSSDGATTWDVQASNTTNNLYGISYVNGNFIAVGASGTILTSTDGAAWTTQTPMTGNDLRSVAYGASTYVAVGDFDTMVSSADDVTMWVEQTTHIITIIESFRAISFGPDEQFVAVGTAGIVAYSSTGADGSWATSSAGTNDALNAVVPNLLYIAVGAAGTNVSGK